MKAAVFHGKHDVRIEEREKPSAGPGQLVVRIDCVGICGTDVEAFRTGSFLSPGMVLGHENVGTVTDVGQGVQGFAPGDRLLCGPPSFCDAMCPSCRRGETNVCASAIGSTRGIGGPDGGYAEYMLVQDAEHAILAKLPDGVDAKDAVLFDIVCVGIHAIRLSRLRFGDNAVVSGAGPVGLALVRLLKASGARNVAALARGARRAAMLRGYGADIVIDADAEPDIEKRLAECFGTGEAADIAFECAGTEQSLKNCMERAVRPGGQVMMVGQVTEPLCGIVPSDSFVRELDLQFSFVFTAKDVEIYMDMLGKGRLDFPGMVTGVIPLGDAVSGGLGLGREARRGHIKILVDPSLGAGRAQGKEET